MSSPHKRTTSEEDVKNEGQENEHSELTESNNEQEADDQGPDSERDRSGSATTEEMTPSATETSQSSSDRPPKKQRRGKNSPEPDYSAMVQEQMSSTNRTGQACDRCKGRKMKCDSNATGCANCSASNLPCTQTDPITRESYTRGELIRLRRDNNRLREENELLRRIAREHRQRQLFGGGNPGFGDGRSHFGGQAGMGHMTNYPSYQGHHPFLSQPNLPAYPYGENPYAAPSRPTSLMPGLQNTQNPFGPMPRDGGYMLPFQGQTPPPPTAYNAAAQSFPTGNFALPPNQTLTMRAHQAQGQGQGQQQQQHQQQHQHPGYTQDDSGQLQQPESFENGANDSPGNDPDLKNEFDDVLP